MTTPRDIARSSLGNAVSYSLEASPAATFHSPPASQGSFMAGSLPTRAAVTAKQLKPFNAEDIKILLLENVNQTGRDILTAQGYQVEFLKTSLPEDQLIEKIR
jgi:D-3-phosphoglycerate dehydrogenase